MALMTGLPGQAGGGQNLISLAQQYQQAGPQAGTPEGVIQARTPEALGLIQAGSEEALRLSQQAQQQFDPLQRFGDLAAFQEQQALLGLSGEEAQRAAIGGIPVSQAQQDLQRRQQQSQLRQAAAMGDISGAALMGAQQLRGSQQMQNIQGRLSQLEPLARIARSTRSTFSQQAEQARAREAGIIGGAGTQAANIRLGAAAPVISGIQQQAELSGLQGISSAQQQAQMMAQLGALGQLAAPAITSYFGPQAGSAGGTAGAQIGYGL